MARQVVPRERDARPLPRAGAISRSARNYSAVLRSSTRSTDLRDVCPNDDKRHVNLTNIRGHDDATAIHRDVLRIVLHIDYTDRGRFNTASVPRQQAAAEAKR